MTAPAAALLARIQELIAEPGTGGRAKRSQDILDLLRDLAAYLAKPLPEEVAQLILDLRGPGMPNDEIEHKAADMLDRLARAGQPTAEDARAAMNEVEAWATTLRQIIERDYGHEQQLDALVAKYGKGAGGALQRLERGIEELARAGQDAEGLRRTFDLQWTRMGDAVARWREGDPERELVRPDLGVLLAWLLAQPVEAEARGYERGIREAAAVCRASHDAAALRASHAHTETYAIAQDGIAKAHSEDAAAILALLPRADGGGT